MITLRATACLSSCLNIWKSIKHIDNGVLCLRVCVFQAGSVFSFSLSSISSCGCANLNTASPWVSFASEWIISAANGAVNKWRLSATPTIWIWIWIAREWAKGSAAYKRSPRHSRRHFRAVEGGATTRHKTDLLGHCWRGGCRYRIGFIYISGPLLRKHLTDNNMP